MAAAQLEAVLRHVRDVAAHQRLTEHSDGALLRAFLSGNDQPAFEALVRRHGPMVLRVCRRTLGNVHDAEDALQATFLVLARQAASIRKRESLASWLHGVAYRMATHAKRAAARRRGHEARVSPAAPPDPALRAAWKELQALLDEEVARLPESLRGPFVLCCLENQSNADAARQLGLQEGTVWNRLGRARKLLRERLSRRGVSLTAVLAAVALPAAAAPAAVARSLVGPTAQAAARVAAGEALAAGPVSAQVISLAEGLSRALFRGKGKTAVLLLVGLVLAGSGLGLAALRGAAPGQDAPGPQARPQPPATRAAAAKGPAFVGRVVDAGGKPAAGADVALLGEAKSNRPSSAWLGSTVLAHGRAGADGKFRLRIARAALADYRTVYVLAGKPGHGLAWSRAELKAPARETVVRLAPAKTLRGRLLDVQGQPAAGVRVRAGVLYGEGNRSAVGPLPRESFPDWPEATTDKDGKFTLAGLNPDCGGLLVMDGEGYTTTQAEIQSGRDGRKQEVNLTLAPARVLEGVVRAADTGKPVPGARVVCLEGGHPVTDRTDARGRYRLRLPAGDRRLPSEVSALPPEGQPYVRRHARLEWPKGAVKHRLDLTLERGVAVRGVVTDAATGKPVAGARALAVDHGGRFLWDRYTRRVTTQGDGGFTVIVPPGRHGHLLVKGPNNDYIATEITTGELLGGRPSGTRVYADAVIPFEAGQGPGAREVKARLRRGVTLRGKLLGPGDKPVTDALMVCWNQADASGLFTDFPHTGVPVPNGTFELRGCDPDVTYPVYFLDARNKLGASARLSAKEAAGKGVTVRLRPCGSAVVRFVDEEGKPRPGYRPFPRLVIRPGARGAAADSEFLANVDAVNYKRPPAAGADGRCAFPVLIPGATYRDFGPKGGGLTARSGETVKREVVIGRRQ